MSKKDFIVGLDIGTTKVCCIVGELSENGYDPGVNIVGVGLAPSSGLRKGVIVNLDSTAESLSKAVDEAQKMSGVPIHTIHSVYAGIASDQIKSFNSSGVVAIKDKVISAQDVQRVIEAAKAVAIPAEREVLHVIPQKYRINDQDGIHDPVGMSGVRLEARVHIVTGAISSVQNIVRCANRAGLSVSEICLEPMVSAQAVLTPEEKDSGVVVVDIGGGTSDIAIFKDGSIVHTGVVALGGNNITNDVAFGLRIPQAEAEKIKVRYGCGMASMIVSDETFEVSGVGGKKQQGVSRRTLAEIIGARVEEIFSLIQREILKSGYQNHLTAGVVITGGASLLEGMPELGEFVFEMPVKRGIPQNVGGLREVVNSPKFATGVGLVQYGARRWGRTHFPNREKSFYDKVRGSMRSWIKDLF